MVVIGCTKQLLPTVGSTLTFLTAGYDHKYNASRAEIGVVTLYTKSTKIHSVVSAQCYKRYFNCSNDEMLLNTQCSFNKTRVSV